MNYRFICKECDTEIEINIPVDKYDMLKNKQSCTNCGCKLERIIEWEGQATAKGGGWFGKSTGGNAI